MQIEVKGRNLQITEDLREVVAKRFDKVAKQVSELAVLQVELCEERNPANPNSMVAEATLHVKGTTLRAKEATSEMRHSINLISEEMARQVKRHRDKRRGRREARSLNGPAPSLERPEAAGGEAAQAL